jgi:lactoylglutathione lyase
VAIGGLDKRVLEALWIDLLGLQVEGHFISRSENVDETIAAVGRGPSRVEIDLMQPLDPNAKPRVHEPALHHIGLWVDDLAAAFQWLSAQGMQFAPGGIRTGAAGHDVCFIHPKSGQGVLIELIQAPAEITSR